MRGRRQSRRQGYVYVVERGDGLVKIGFTEHPRHRLRALSDQHRYDVYVWALVKGTMAHEAMLHRRYAADRVEGEWFRPSDDLLERCDEGTLFDIRGGLCKFQRAPSSLDRWARAA